MNGRITEKVAFSPSVLVYPAIGVSDQNTQIAVNFGQHAFEYQIHPIVETVTERESRLSRARKHKELAEKQRHEQEQAEMAAKVAREGEIEEQAQTLLQVCGHVLTNQAEALKALEYKNYNADDAASWLLSHPNACGIVQALVQKDRLKASQANRDNQSNRSPVSSSSSSSKQSTLAQQRGVGSEKGKENSGRDERGHVRGGRGVLKMGYQEYSTGASSRVRLRQDLYVLHIIRATRVIRVIRAIVAFHIISYLSRLMS